MAVTPNPTRRDHLVLSVRVDCVVPAVTIRWQSLPATRAPKNHTIAFAGVQALIE